MADLDWSDEHVSRANRFALHAVVAWVALMTLSAALAGSGSLGLVVRGVLALGVTWLLVHSLFTQVDGLVQTRLAEAEANGGARTDDRAGSDG